MNDASALVRGLVAAFNRRKPVRAGSLIVTLYGDAIVPRGGSLSLGDITSIMALFRIDSGHVRTAISRLTSEKWLERRKVGRNTFYRLSKQGEGAFADATKRIYFPRKTDAVKSIRVALLNGEASGRAAQRKKLEAAGYVAFNALTYVSTDLESTPPNIKGVFALDVAASAESTAIVREAFHLDELAGRYEDFVELFGTLLGALGMGAKFGDSESLIIRLLLIQEFRRIVLREPALAPGMFPHDWPGDMARATAAAIYGAVLKGSERFLDGRQADEKNPLPKPNSSLTQRFAALR